MVDGQVAREGFLVEACRQVALLIKLRAGLSLWMIHYIFPQVLVRFSKAAWWKHAA